MIDSGSQFAVGWRTRGPSSAISTFDGLRTRGAYNSPTGSAVSSSGSSTTSGAAAPPGRFSEIQVSMRSHQSYSHWSWVS